MNIENQQLILFTGRMIYHLQVHEQKKCPNSLKQAKKYKAKAQAVLRNMTQETGNTASARA